MVALAREPANDCLVSHELPQSARRDYHTVARFVLDRLRQMPNLSDAFEAGGWRFEMVDMDGRRIDKALAQPRPARVVGYRA